MTDATITPIFDPKDAQTPAYKNAYSKKLIQAKNIIFRGAPGTGKSYLAKAIAADIVSNGTKSKYSDLSAEEQNQVAFVQFHPSYDYSDFVEGLRPVANNGQIGFELRPGIFKSFVNKARKNLENAKKAKPAFLRLSCFLIILLYRKIPPFVNGSRACMRDFFIFSPFLSLSITPRSHSTPQA